MTMSSKMFLLVSVMVGVVQGQIWNNGAKNNNTVTTPYTSQCIAGNFRPSNGDYMPTNTPPPFTISVVTSRKNGYYYPGEAVEVHISSSSPNSAFRAYHIRGDCSKPVFNGTLTCEGGKPSNLCNELKNPNTQVDAVTNTNYTMKTLVKCSWIPPPYSVGSVQFAATIVASQRLFWTGVLSNSIKASPTATTYEAHQSLLWNRKVAEFQKKMMNMNQIITNVQSQMGQMGQMGGKGSNPFQSLMGQTGQMGQMGGKASNPFASMLAGATAGKTSQQMNPMMAMMNNMMGGQRKQSQNNRFANQQKWGPHRFSSFINGGEQQGGEAGEHQGFTW